MDCTKHEAVEAEIKQLKEDVKAIFDRIRPLEDSRSRTEEIVKSLFKAVDDLSKNIDTKISTLTIKVEALKEKPGERWEKLIWLVVGAAVMYAFKKMGA